MNLLGISEEFPGILFISFEFRLKLKNSMETIATCLSIAVNVIKKI